jgi:phosphoenolpyruvate---glycerone phosphotransferase subunit DhaL
MQITAEHVIRFIERIAARVREQQAELTALDAAIGDADHGSNLERGFSAVLAKLPTVADNDIGTILKSTGTTLVSTVGGAAGPLYGTAFLRAGAALADRTELSADDLLAALKAALAGVMARGKAQRGEKTMIDTIAPGIDALEAALARGLDLRDALLETVEAILSDER